MHKSFLVFSDPHITPEGYDYRILEEIRCKIIQARPDYIICTGDLGEFASQNRLVKDRGSFDPATELSAVIEAMIYYILDPIKMIQDKQRRDKKKLYKPEVVFCLGNHDVNFTSQLKLVLEDRGAFVFPYKHTVEVMGICFCHTFDNGISGQPCTDAKTIMQNTMYNTVSGHSHVRSAYEATNAVGDKFFTLKMPCATMANPDWTPQGCLKWDRGYLWLTVDDETDWYQYTFRTVESIHG